MNDWGTNIILEGKEALFITEQRAFDLKERGIISSKNLVDILLVNQKSDKIKIIKHPKKDIIYVSRSQKAFDSVYDTLLATQILTRYNVIPRLLAFGDYDKKSPLKGNQWLLFEYLKDHEKVKQILPNLKEEKEKKSLLSTIAEVCATLTKTGYWFDPRLSNFAALNTDDVWDVKIINLDLRREDNLDRRREDRLHGSFFYKEAENRFRQLAQQTRNGKDYSSFFISQYKKYLKK